MCNIISVPSAAYPCVYASPSSYPQDLQITVAPVSSHPESHKSNQEAPE